MSCWVAPSLAAELWHIPLDEIMRLIREAKLSVKIDEGFTFVDIAPPPAKPAVQLRRPEDRPAMFTPIPTTAHTTPDDLPDDTQCDEVESGTLGDWRSARLKAGRTRVAPRRVVA